jgi:hypothetical protein
MNTSSIERSNRPATIRRLYFYLVALASLIAALAGLDTLLRYLSEAWLARSDATALVDQGYLRQMIASSGGFLLVATPIFLLHWSLIQRRAAEVEERNAALRKFFLYVASGVAVGYLLVQGFTLVSGLARLALGEPLSSSSLWPSDWLHLLLILAASLGLQLYLRSVLLEDGDYGREDGFGINWRRLYQVIAGLVGLGMVIQGCADGLQTLWQALVDWQADALSVGSDLWRYQFSDGLALALLGAVLLRINWQRWLRIADALPAEARAGLRRFYLYAAVVISALATLIPAANLLRELLLQLLGSSSVSGGELLNQLVEPLAYIPCGLVAWVWHWRYLRQEVAQHGESREAATVRRLYYYLVAATGLTLLWFGAVALLQALLDALLVADPTTGRLWVEPLATGLSLLIVGAPIWSLHWQAARAQARRSDVVGASERGSLPRRVYLYGVALVGALLILFYLAQVIYRLLLLLLGDPDAQLISVVTANDLARSVIAAVWWGVHLWALRGDTQMGGGEATPMASERVETQRAVLEQRVAQLESELAAARAQLAQLGREP